MLHLKNSSLSKIDFKDFAVIFHNELVQNTASEIDPCFSERYSTGFVLEERGEKTSIKLVQNVDSFIAEHNGIIYSLSYSEGDECIEINTSVKNNSLKAFEPESLSLRLGIDTYMAEYPQWNKNFFPTFLRCEKTHFHGYFMSPDGKILGIGCANPIASYSFCYNVHTEGFGHRIYTVDIQLLSAHKLPARHPENLISLGVGETLVRKIKLFPIKKLDDYESEMSKKINVPMLYFKRTAVAKGEQIKLDIASSVPYKVKTVSPDGSVTDKTDFKAEQTGEYLFTVTDINGKISEARAVCHRTWRDYLIAAGKAAYNYPQKATTHAESYYGFYSAFLAKKIQPNNELDRKLLNHFEEIMPLMFDMDKGVPLLIPQRIQNTSTVVGILVDLYESDTDNCRWALDKAMKFADYLLDTQSEDGAYRRNGKLHYTCVIYIAKSVLELTLALKAAGGNYAEQSEKYYESVCRAVDDLVLHLDNIGTEGEQTFEDGMISCSALQIGMFALTLPDSKRKKYTDAAEYMLTKHRCLENKRIADYRMNGGSLRFWESQYDVMVFHNFMNSPHGWTAWSAYASYYLYLLTGKEEYILQTYNTLGACTALIQPDGRLNWAFCADPCIKAEMFVPDEEKTVTDAYKNVPDTPAYRAKTKTAEFGECYIPMISNWYRTGICQNVTGGYSFCPLILPDRCEEVDPQGGCCDNDVHEIFKCLEETLMDKLFIIEKAGTIISYGGETGISNGKYYVTLTDDIKQIHINTENDITLCINGSDRKYKSGRYFVNIRE